MPSDKSIFEESLFFKKEEGDLPSRTLAMDIHFLLEDKKAHDVLVLDIRKKASFAEYLVIASGHNARHVVALGQHVLKTLKNEGIDGRVEGLPLGDWVLLDFGNVIVHLFRPEVRARYQLEKMWGEP